MDPTQSPPSKATAPSATTNMSAQVETVSAEPQAFELTTPMSIPAGTEILVTCRGGIKLEMFPSQHVILSAKTSIKLLSPTAMEIEPAEQLGPAFARGWHKLPDELRIQVLAHNLVSPDPIRRTADGFEFTMSQTLYDYLAMGPEIARLAHDTFYRENAFQSSASSRSGLMMMAQPFILPPYPLRPLIKRMTLVVDIDERDWD